MLEYVTMVYEGESFDEKFGWDFGNIILFESERYLIPGDAMLAFRRYRLPEKPWFAYMRVLDNEQIIADEMFDSNVISEA